MAASSSKNNGRPASVFCRSELSHEANLANESLTQALGAYFDKCARKNDANPSFPERTSPDSMFFSVAKPGISTFGFSERLITYLKCSTSSVAVSLVYLRRLRERNSVFVLTSFNLHRLSITALLLASKFCEDVTYCNSFFAKVGGVTVSELNALERHMLHILNYRLLVSLDHYAEMIKEMKQMGGEPMGGVLVVENPDNSIVKFSKRTSATKPHAIKKRTKDGARCMQNITLSSPAETSRCRAENVLCA